VRRLVLVIAALVIVPIIEIAVLIAVGQVIGLGWTLLLMLGTSALGGWLLRHQGSRAWRTFRSDLDARRPPGSSATDGLLILVGGIFMLVPGFVSDVIGLVLILPPTRRVGRGMLQRAVERRLTSDAATTLFGPRRVRVRTGPTRPTSPPTTSGRPPVAGSSGPTSSGSGAARTPPLEGEIIDPR
jgi:UPF0716 protein FxsA